MKREVTPFGKRLMKLKEERKLTDTALAKKMRIAPPQLFLLYRTAQPREKTLQILSKIFSKPVGFWLAGLKTKRPGTMASQFPSSSQTKGSDIGKAEVYLLIILDGKERRVRIS
jgi:hypothetical protein